MDKINVYLEYNYGGMDFGFLNEKPENKTITKIQSIDKPTRVSLRGSNIYYADGTVDVLFNDRSAKDQLCERIRKLFHAISKNKNVIQLKIYGDQIHIPGALLAELLNLNKSATDIFLRFGKRQSDMQLLCDALQRDTTIKNITFYENELKETDLLLLGEALRGSRGIENFHLGRNDDNNNIVVLKAALRPGSNIKGLTVNPCIGLNSTNYGFKDQVAKILTENTTLTTFTLKKKCCDVESVVQILQGVIDSNITEFYYFPFGPGEDECEDMFNVDFYKHQLEHLQMIEKMKKLKLFSFKLNDFHKLSIERIISAIRSMSSLRVLEIKLGSISRYGIHAYFKHPLQDIIQDLSTWERTCKLKLTCNSPSLEVISLLKSVQLEIFVCHVNRDKFDKIIEEIPMWNYLKELNITLDYISFDSNITQMQESKFVAAVSKNTLLKKILFTGRITLRYQAQSKIDDIVVRNVRLADSKEYPENVPIAHWPELFAMASSIGLDYLYEYIQKITVVFVGFLPSGPGKDDSSRSLKKDDVSDSNVKTNAKRARTL